MIDYKHIETLKRAVETWGARSQMEMLQEECIELALATRKHLRKETKQSFDNLIDEVADVLIMVTQMDIVFGDDFFGLVTERVKFKVERLEKRLLRNSFEALPSESHDTSC